MYIPSNIKQSSKEYALGKYVINPAYTNNQSLEHWIQNIQFEKFESQDHRMQLHSRKRNNLYTFYLPSIDKEVVLKVSQISRQYRWYRKLNLLLVSLIKNYSLNAYYGGIALDKINIDSLKVIAHWTCKRQNESNKSYLLYEKVDASMSVFDFCDRLSNENNHSTDAINQVSKSLANIIRNIHTNNIRHGDPHAGNFLLRSNIDDISQITPADVKQLKFTLIDLDKMQFVRNESKWRKKILDIRCIRRFRVHNIDSTKCLEHYLGNRPNLYEKAILKFWMKGGLNIYKWFKQGNKRN